MDWGVEGVAGTPAFRAPEAPSTALRRLRLGALMRFVLPGSAPPALARDRGQGDERATRARGTPMRPPCCARSSDSRTGWPWRPTRNRPGSGCGDLPNATRCCSGCWRPTPACKFLLFFLREGL